MKVAIKFESLVLFCFVFILVEHHFACLLLKEIFVPFLSSSDLLFLIQLILIYKSHILLARINSFKFSIGVFCETFFPKSNTCVHSLI